MNQSSQYTKNERNLLGGFDVWKQIFPALSFIYFIFGWFAVTLEVFLRRDFGERYFTRLNFFAGFIVLSGFNMAQSLIGGFWREGGVATWKESVMWFVLLAYIALSIYHLFTIWWRDRIGKPLHSLDSGKSWLEPLAGMLLAAVNSMLTPIFKVLAKTLPSHQQQGVLKVLPVLRDKRSFAENVLEPVACVVVLFLVFISKLAIPTFWLLYAIPALILYTSFRHQAERNSFLDIQDSIIEADQLKTALQGNSETFRLTESVKDSLKQLATQIENKPEAQEMVQTQSPSIFEAMEAINPKLRNITSEDNTNS